MMALNVLVVECEMFAAHMNNLGSSALAVDQSGRDLNICRTSEQRVIIGTSSHLSLHYFCHQMHKTCTMGVKRPQI